MLKLSNRGDSGLCCGGIGGSLLYGEEPGSIDPGVLTIFMHGVKGNHLGDKKSIEGEGIDTQLTLLRLLGFSEK